MNKSQRRELAGKRAMEVALQSLEKIEKHEKECGERWSEAVSEIKNLRSMSEQLMVTSNAHSARWERLAWLVVGTVFATAIAHLFGIYF